MKETTRQESPYAFLIDAAEGALDFAVAPYSHFQVGSALLDSEGRIWTGCNVENAAFFPGTCAERTALYKAISEGSKNFKAIAIVGRHEGFDALTREFTSPCGVCRQALNEFCAADMPIILCNAEGKVREYTLGELLPASFGPKNLDTAKKEKN